MKSWFNIKLFASELPCKLSDYEFTGMDRTTWEILQTSDLADRVIKTRGYVTDYLGRTDLDGIAVLKDKKDPYKCIFRVIVKDGKRSYEPILGLQFPDYPEAIMCNDKTVIYSFTAQYKKDRWKDVDMARLDAQLVDDELANGYHHIHGWLTPISTKEGSGKGLKLMDYIEDSEYEAILDMYTEAKTENKSLKIDIYQGEGMSKVSASIVSFNSYRIVDSFYAKYGKPISIDKFPDLHNHLIPGVDDGSGSFKESIELAEDLKGMGITKIVLTPHNNENFSDQQLQKDRYEKLKDELPIESYLASENKIGERFLANLVNETHYQFHPNGFLLIEFSQDDSRSDILDSVGKLLPYFKRLIIAHPCRYKNLTIQDLADISGSGVLLQCNLKSLDSEQDRDVVHKLRDMISKGLVDIISTDTHHESHIDQTEGKIEEFKECLIFNKAII